jgi:hypothetical protein
MLSFTQFLREQNLTIEELLQSNEVLSIIEELEENEELTEASFQFGGKTYKTAWGKYSCDGKSITRDEYLKASNAYKNSNKVGYKEKAKQNIKSTGEKVQKQSANIRINVRDARNKLEELRKNVRVLGDYDYLYLDDKDLEKRDIAASNIKLLKKYHEQPDSLSEKEKKYIDNLYKNKFKGRKNKDKDALNYFMDDYSRRNRLINRSIDWVNKAYQRYKSGDDSPIDFEEF